jgi:hypothetical protein
MNSKALDSWPPVDVVFPDDFTRKCLQPVFFNMMAGPSTHLTTDSVYPITVLCASFPILISQPFFQFKRF